MKMKTSADGRGRLTVREGLRLHAYLDSVNVPTIGVGHTGRMSPPKVKLGDVITAQQADDYLEADLGPTEDTVNGLVKAPLNQHQFDALVSLVFNIGAPNFSRSTVLKRLNAGDYAGAAQTMLLWDMPKAILGRRHTEVDQFNLPVPGAQPPPKSAPSGPEVPEPDMHLPWTRKLDQLLAGQAIMQSAINAVRDTVVAQGKQIMALGNDIMVADQAEADSVNKVLAEFQDISKTLVSEAQQVIDANNRNSPADVAALAVRIQGRAKSLNDAANAMQQQNVSLQASILAAQSGTDSLAGASGNDSIVSGSDSTSGASGAQGSSTVTGNAGTNTTSDASGNSTLSGLGNDTIQSDAGPATPPPAVTSSARKGSTSN